MLEVYKELGLKEIEGELKTMKFPKPKPKRGKSIQDEDEGESKEHLLVEYGEK